MNRECISSGRWGEVGSRLARFEWGKEVFNLTFGFPGFNYP
jgi:hypothetical protein